MAGWAALVVTLGCGASGGAFLYHLGVGRSHKVQAEFQLSPGPILILVDDFGERLKWPEVRDLLAGRVANDLLDHKATERIISNDDVRRLRQARADLDSRGCREVGRMLGADQVLWIEVIDFLASENIEDTNAAAWMAVTVKVINARATRRQEVRLWPREREGRPIRVELSATEVTRANKRLAIARELTAKLARATARLFYDHTLEDLVRP